ncbi:hypothetical protein ACROYT_G034441 [Oculina patagonica]
MLRRGGQRKQAKSEEEKVLTPTPEESQDEVVEEENTSTDSESETEPLTTYCNNGCQGACACPSLEPPEPAPEPQREHSEPTLSPQSSLSPPDVPPPEPLPEVSKPDSQSSLRRRSLDKGRLTFQHLKEKLHVGYTLVLVTGAEVNWTEVDEEEAKAQKMNAGQACLRDGGNEVWLPEVSSVAVSKSVKQAHNTRQSLSSYFVEYSASKNPRALKGSMALQ